MQRILIVLAVIVLAGGSLYMGVMTGDEQSADQASGQTGEQGSRTRAFGFDDIKQLVTHLNPRQRQAALSQPDFFKKVVGEEVVRLALLDAAEANKLDQNNNLKYLIKRKSDDLLLQNFISRQVLSAGGIPKGFPSEQQVKTYYEQNKSKFVVPERVPVWQIFWQVPTNTSKLDQARIIKRASSLSWQLKKGKKNFAETAQQVSQHGASRLNGGFMGILKVSELKPEIKSQLLALKIDEISAPIRGAEGVHIFRRGKIFPQTVLPLTQARGQIVQLLRKAFNQSQRLKLNQLAVKKYPVKFEDGAIEKWWARLSKEMAAGSGK